MNAKEELVKFLEGKEKVKCAKLIKDSLPDGDYDEYLQNPEFILKVNYTDEEFQAFLDSLNFEYDHSYGRRELHGIIWLEDGTWCTRCEYGGSEWWLHNIPPEIPLECKLDETTQKIAIKFAEFVAGYPDKNRNKYGDMLHARSKYDVTETTKDLFREFLKTTN